RSGPRQIIVAEAVAGLILWSDRAMTELQRSHAELRTAVMLAGKEDSQAELWASRQPSSCRSSPRPAGIPRPRAPTTSPSASPPSLAPAFTATHEWRTPATLMAANVRAHPDFSWTIQPGRFPRGTANNRARR